MRFSTTTARFATVLAAAMVVAEPASAACTRLAFSVNDYGKDGPIKDAKRLLDTYVAKWTAERGIKTYRIGKKDVSCELFLDVIVFDEHTCKAEATVCWDGPPVTGQTQAATPGVVAKPVAAPRPAGAITKFVTPPPAAAPANSTSRPATIETGAVTGASIGTAAPAVGPKASPPADTVPPAKAVAAPAPKAEPVKAVDSATEQALQAAQRAAAAAERAAAAAERAAAAAAAAEKAPVKAQ